MTDTDDLEMTNEDESFADLLEQSLSSQSGRLAPGQKVSARVLKVSSEWLLVDTGHKGEGVVDL
jgi:small subunit ribosomal protein S1